MRQLLQDFIKKSIDQILQVSSLPFTQKQKKTRHPATTLFLGLFGLFSNFLSRIIIIIIIIIDTTSTWTKYKKLIYYADRSRN